MNIIRQTVPIGVIIQSPPTPAFITGTYLELTNYEKHELCSMFNASYTYNDISSDGATALVVSSLQHSQKCQAIILVLVTENQL